VTVAGRVAGAWVRRRLGCTTGAVTARTRPLRLLLVLLVAAVGGSASSDPALDSVGARARTTEGLEAGGANDGGGIASSSSQQQALWAVIPGPYT